MKILNSASNVGPEFAKIDYIIKKNKDELTYGYWTYLNDRKCKMSVQLISVN